MPTLRKRPVVLVIRDGWGNNPHHDLDYCNAVRKGKTPISNALVAKYPTVTIRTSGEDVGLPDGVMGNSEVGHQNIGAGRIVDQEMMRITRAIRDRSFFANEVFKGALAHAVKTGGDLHLLGLLSDGGVHSHIDHLVAMLELCKENKFPADRLFIHAITDGRDTAPQSGRGFVEYLQKAIDKNGMGRIASIIGRYFAMDRDFRWDRVQKAYDILTKGSERVAKTAEAALDEYYAHPTAPNLSGDEFVTATSISSTGKVEDPQRIKNGDAVIFFNFRGDRPRELVKAFIATDEEWTAIQGGGFERGKRLNDLYFATFSQYEEGLNVKVAFVKPPKMENILGGYLSSLGLKQFRYAESEKHPHVTYFFNDYRKGCFPGEFQLDIPSPKHVATYDQKPEMSAYPLTDCVVNAVASGIFDFILINYANGDMVGHTGSLPAAIAAVEAVDQCVGRLVDAVSKAGGSLMITADHGNCEQMVDPETGGPHTQHTTYEVDLMVVDDGMVGRKLRSGGRLADIAPTLLELMGLPKPQEMSGESLLAGR